MVSTRELIENLNQNINNRDALQKDLSNANFQNEDIKNMLEESLKQLRENESYLQVILGTIKHSPSDTIQLEMMLDKIKEQQETYKTLLEKQGN